MSESNGKPAKGLANLSAGQLITALGPLGLVVWQGMVWATEIEANVKANQRHIEELIEQVKVNDETDERHKAEIIDAIERLGDRDSIEPDSSRDEPVD